MSESNTQDIGQWVRQRAKELIRTAKPPPPQWVSGNEPPEMEKRTCFTQAMLESYRKAPENHPIRKDIDNALRVHRDLCLSTHDTMARKRHNTLILEYVIENRQSHSEIARQLGISTNTLREYKKKGIREMARIMSYDFELIPTGHGGRA